MSEAEARFPRSGSWLRLRAAEAPPLGAIFGGILLLAAGATALLGLARLPFPVCVFKAVSGIPCPTCGSTRALACLAQLDFAGAFAMNPLAAAGAFVVGAWALLDLALLPQQRALALELRPALGRAARVAAVLALALNWVYLIAAGR
jgi:hypothetical protein